MAAVWVAAPRLEVPAPVLEIATPWLAVGSPWLAFDGGAGAARAAEAAKRRSGWTLRTAADSLKAARVLLATAIESHGGRAAWERLETVSYTADHVMPGPGGATVRSWQEQHVAWLHGPPRIRIDNAADSTVIIVSGDTTRVQRAGAWASEPEIVSAMRDEALDALWILALPWSVADTTAELGLVDRATERTGAERSGAERSGTERSGTERTGAQRSAERGGSAARSKRGAQRLALRVRRRDGALATLAFDRDGRVSEVHFYHPGSRAWFVAELSEYQTRDGWAWAGRRALYSSDPSGARGPLAWTVQIGAMDLHPQAPESILRPPGAQGLP